MENKLILFVLLYLSFNVSFVLSIGNLLLSSGPSCAVSTLIPGTPNQSVQTMKGTCYSSLICRQQGGVPIGRCGVSNVCCVFPRTCGGIASHNSTYFTNPGFPSSYNNLSNTCVLTVHRIPGVNRICQLKLDFMDFEILQPNKGNCDKDYFTVNGQNLNSVVPTICGYNSGQHMYVDVDGVQGPVNLNVQTSGTGHRRWNILVSQIECNNPSKAPSNCLQYFMGPIGEITSFNYDIILHQNTNEVNPKPDQLPSLNTRGIGYMNGMDYSICFRKEQFYCYQTYSVNYSNSGNTFNDESFSISSSVIGDKKTNVGGAGVAKCPQDFLELGGIRYCGYRLNPRAIDSKEEVTTNEEVNDNGSGPFVARFYSDNSGVEPFKRGFKIGFRQKSCLTGKPQTIQVTEKVTEKPSKESRYGSVLKISAQVMNSTSGATHKVIIGSSD